jgi:hypothetical protein
MGYSKFKTIKEVTKKFNLDMRLERLFQMIETVEPSGWLLETLAIAEKLPLTNEKSKAERVISPILTEVAKVYADKVSFFSGEQINIKPEDDLAGECDFFFSLQPPKLYIDAPIISLAEAKDEDMDWGIAQCAAQMLGAKLFNEQENKHLPFIYGCATDGVEWKFMKLENDIYYVDNKIYTDLKEILGAWHHVIKLFL